jgi:hypothetical protein
MNPLTYLKSVIAAVGAVAVPPISSWVAAVLSKAMALTFIGAVPDNVQSAFALLLTAVITGGAVYATPNKTP